MFFYVRATHSIQQCECWKKMLALGDRLNKGMIEMKQEVSFEKRK